MPSKKQGYTYAALGDSVASGTGLWLPQEASSQDRMCSRSPLAYPTLVAKQIGFKLKNAACTGALTKDLYQPHASNGSYLDSQLDQAYSQGPPKLLTITIGANDIHWINFMASCYTSKCDTTRNQHEENNYVKDAGDRLLHVLSEIRRRSTRSTQPLVIVTGYYNPFGSDCKNRLPQITDSELDFLQKQRDSLNATIRDTAIKSGFARYAPVNFDGHSLCSDNPWTQDLKDNAPLHPSPAGQRQIAKSVIRTLNTPSSVFAQK